MTFSEQLIIFLIILVGAKDLGMAFARKRGWINGNGNEKSKEIGDLKQQLTLLEDNHLHNLGEKIDKLTEKMIEHNAEELTLLKDIKEKLK